MPHWTRVGWARDSVGRAKTAVKRSIKKSERMGLVYGKRPHLKWGRLGIRLNRFLVRHFVCLLLDLIAERNVDLRSDHFLFVKVVKRCFFNL